MTDNRTPIPQQQNPARSRPMSGERLCTISWTCSVVAACAAFIAIPLVQYARSPIDGVALLAAAVFLIGTWGGGMLGVIFGLVGLASPARRAATNFLTPLLANVAVAAGFTLLIKLVHIGPSLHGGPASF